MRSTRPQQSRSVCSGNPVLYARKYGFVGCFGRCEQLLVATRSSFSKGTLQNDICRFESSHPSHAVRSPLCNFRVWENRRHSRGLGRRAPVSSRDRTGWLLCWGVRCQALQTFFGRSEFADVARRGHAFLRDGRCWPSQDGIRRMRRTNLGSVLAVRPGGSTSQPTDSPHPSSLRDIARYRAADNHRQPAHGRPSQPNALERCDVQE